MTQNTPENQPQNPPANDQNAGPNPVSLDDATIQRIADASQRQAAQNVNNGSGQQQQNSGAESNGQQNHAPSNNAGQSGDAVLTAIQALPEQITRSIKEALQPPSGGSGSQQQNSGAQSNGGTEQQQQNSGQPSQAPGQKKSFADWWFGK